MSRILALEHALTNGCFRDSKKGGGCRYGQDAEELACETRQDVLNLWKKICCFLGREFEYHDYQYAAGWTIYDDLRQLEYKAGWKELYHSKVESR